MNSRPGSVTSYGRVAMDAAGDFVVTWLELAPGDGSAVRFLPVASRQTEHRWGDGFQG